MLPVLWLQNFQSNFFSETATWCPCPLVKYLQYFFRVYGWLGHINRSGDYKSSVTSIISFSNVLVEESRISLHPREFLVYLIWHSQRRRKRKLKGENAKLHLSSSAYHYWAEFTNFSFHVCSWNASYLSDDSAADCHPVLRSEDKVGSGHVLHRQGRVICSWEGGWGQEGLVLRRHGRNKVWGDCHLISLVSWGPASEQLNDHFSIWFKVCFFLACQWLPHDLKEEEISWVSSLCEELL